MLPLQQGQGNLPQQPPLAAQPGQIPVQGAPQQPPVVHMANGQQFPAGHIHNVPPAQNPQAGHIQDDWNQSVAQLNNELRQVREAMADLLTEIRALIQEHNLHTQLTQVSTAVDASLNAVGEAFRSTDRVGQALSVVDTTGWPQQAVQSFNHSMSTFQQRLAQARLPLPANPPVLVPGVGNQAQPPAPIQAPVQGQPQPQGQAPQHGHPQPQGQAPLQGQPQPQGQAPLQGQPQPQGQAPLQGQPQPQGQAPLQGQPQPQGQAPQQGQPQPQGQAPLQGQPQPQGQAPGGEEDQSDEFI